MYQPIDEQRLKSALILIVDDVELNRKILDHSLRAHGFTNTVNANDGSEALDLTLRLKPDLVLLDLMMPTMDGYAYCDAIRQNSEFDNMPILVQTALDALDQKLRAFNAGASDYVCKPVDAGELAARARLLLSNRLLVQDLRNYQKRMEEQLAAARQMQDRLMPSANQIRIAERVFDMQIATHYQNSLQLGGDSWGMQPLSETRLGLFMYDFSGHGVSASMNVFRMHTLIQEYLHASGDPGGFLTTLNRHIFQLIERIEFATMFYGVLDMEANCLIYSSAAAPPILIIRAEQDEPVFLTNRGFPMGVIENATFETKYIPFMKGDILVVFSDCLIESTNAAGEMISEDEIVQIVIAAKKSVAAPSSHLASHIVEALTQRLLEHTSGKIQDDLTISVYARE